MVDGHIGPGYGKRSPEGDAAAELVARTEGVFLDPIFAAKAMAGLLAAVRRGEVAGPVVFLVTRRRPDPLHDPLRSFSPKYTAMWFPLYGGISR